MRGLFVLCLFALGESAVHHHHKRVKRDVPTPDTNNPGTDAIEDSEYWLNNGRDHLKSSLDSLSRRNENVAKNVILFVGDGMSLPTLTAARIYKAQRNGDHTRAERGQLFFETFPHVGLSKTYDINKQVPDSSATASAMFSGVKTKHATLGFDSSINGSDVNSMRTATKVSTILQWAQEAGMDTGVVSTSRLTHATPAALYAHTYDRDWECDSEFDTLNGTVSQPEDLHDIAWQFVNEEPGKNIKVALAGGYPAFFPREMQEELQNELGRYSDDWNECFRSDGLNLAQQWLDDHGERSKLAMNLDDLNKVNIQETDYLLGLFAETHVEYDDMRVPDRDPTISMMTTKAIEMLQKSDNGFFLMVEGGRIDHAHHDVQATRALSETVALDAAVEAAMEKLGEDLDNTLIIVTADHAHTMSISGYPDRGTDIRGLSGQEYNDDLPYTTLSYANGRTYYDYNTVDSNNVTRVNLSEAFSEEALEDFDFEYPSAAYKKSETHGGDDVGIFARGPMAHLFHTSHEQTHIANVMAYSACVGPYKREEGRCEEADRGFYSNSASQTLSSGLSVLLVSTLAALLS